MSRSSDTPDPPDWAAERWRRSPLKREAVVRIFDATTGGRFNLAPAVLPHREALYLTLADLAAVLIEYGSRPGWATPEQAKRVDRTLRAYVAALRACSDTREPPLMLPPTHVEQNERWAEAHSTSMFGKGRPPSDFDHTIYPSLLALYALAFGRKPSAAVGPTHRFLQSTFTEVHSAFGGENRRWEAPSSEALEKRLPPFLSGGMSEISDREVRAIFERNQAGLSRADRGK